MELTRRSLVSPDTARDALFFSAIAPQIVDNRDLYIAAIKTVRDEIAARPEARTFNFSTVDLARERNAQEVRVAVWDLGTNPDLFTQQLFTNAAEQPNGTDDDGNGQVDDIHGLAFDADAPNTALFETVPLVKPTGFREYDARWLYGPEINLLGIQALGLGLGTYIRGEGKNRIVVGHDYRSYSLSIKQALTLGLVAAGCEVIDIGLSITPMAYFAQFALEVEGVAMVTAAAFQSAGRVRDALLLTLGGILLVKLPVLLLASGMFSLTGIWAAEAASELILCIVAVIMLRRFQGSARAGWRRAEGL